MRALLIDDETFALDFLEHQLRQVSEIEIVDKLTEFDMREHTNALENSDVVFLDIEMPETNGLELADLIQQTHPDINIVFVTAYNEYAIEAFEKNILDYVLKPVEESRLKRTVERIYEKIDTEDTFVKNTLLEINFIENLSFNHGNAFGNHLAWRTNKGKDLFVYLLHKQNEMVSKKELTNIFWENIMEDKANSQLYTTIYQIRQVIYKYNNHLSLINLQDGYMLKTNNVYIDLFEWEKKIDLLPELNILTFCQWEEAMELYSARLPKYSENQLLESIHYRYVRLWKNIAYKMADFYSDNHEQEKAEKWYLNICTNYEEEEEAHFKLMLLYDQLGLGLLINHQYKVLENALSKLDIEMDTKIQKWYEVFSNDK